MPTTRLYQQFQRLAQQLGCDEREISLAEVADLLCCTTRNARLLLRRMEGQGWLCWTAGRAGAAPASPCSTTRRA
jgi:SgrR family transcriptional regulator